MSAQQLPCLEELEQQVEKEALRTSEKFRHELLKEEESQVKSTNKEEDQREVKLNIPEQTPILKAINIFGQLPERQGKINIFANCKSVNLFNLSQQKSSTKAINIFDNALTAQPSVLLKQDEESENSEAEDQGHQQLKEPTELVMKYHYQKQFQKVGEFKLVKFKAGEGSLKEGVVITLERSCKQEDKLLYFFLRSQITKVLVYHSIVLPQTKTEHFANKKENIKLTVIKSNQNDKRVEKKLEKELVKLQFENEEDARRFEEVLASYKKN